MMHSSSLKAKVKEYKKLRRRFIELRNLMEAVESDIKLYMGENEELNIDGVHITWTKYRALHFDSKAFKNDHMGIYEQYVKTTDARRFHVA